jgi:predicted secreted protein
LYAEHVIKSLLSLLLAVFFCSGCTDQGVNISLWDGTPLLDASINGKEMTVGVDYRFRLQLEVLADAGLTWDLSLSDSSILQLDRVSFRSASTSTPPPPGSAVFETFYFHTKAEGRCTVMMIHHQAWMLTLPPRDSIGFVVDVWP